MKRMICYFALCALILGCIAGCLSVEPEKSTEPSGNASVQGTATLPDVALNTLPAADWDLYILTGTNEIVYYTSKANNHYGFYIYSKEPLDVYSIEVTLPISHGYEVSVKECTLGGIQADVDAGARDDEHLFSSDSFSYPLYLAYRDMDFAKLALLREEWRALYAQYEAGGYTEQWLNGELTREEYEQLREPHETAKAEYDAALNAQWEDYLALTAEDLPPFYVYHVGIAFSYQTIEAEESFTQMEISIGDQVYHQPIGKITLKGELEAPAPIDWGEEWGGIDGCMGEMAPATPYNEGVHCLEVLYRFTADRYKLLERITFANPAQQIDRIWVDIQPEVGSRSVVQWDMTEPLEVYPGDQVTVYVSYREEGMEALGYQTMVYSYLEYTMDGERYCKYAQCWVYPPQRHYVWYAMTVHGLDLEPYYRDYYYPTYEPWRNDPTENPAPKVGGE